MIRSIGYGRHALGEPFILQFHGTLDHYGENDLFYNDAELDYVAPTEIMMMWVPEGATEAGMTATGIQNHGDDLLTDTPMETEPPPIEPPPEPEQRHERKTHKE